MRVRALAVAALSAMLLTACGNGPGAHVAAPSTSAASRSSAHLPSAAELAGEAADALGQAGAVRIQGPFTSGGVQAVFDLHLQRDGAHGTVTLPGERVVHLIMVGGAAYLQAPAPYWLDQSVPEAAAARLGTVWVLVPADKAGPLATVDLAGLERAVRGLANGSSDDLVEAGQFDGASVLTIGDFAGNTAMIAAESPHYPLTVTTVGDHAGQLTLSEFGVTQPIVPPLHFLDLSGPTA